MGQLRDHDRFDFSLLGVRVPAILISPYTSQARDGKPPAVASDVLDHASMVRTLQRRLNDDQFLSPRVANTADLFDAFGKMPLASGDPQRAPAILTRYHIAPATAGQPQSVPPKYMPQAPIPKDGTPNYGYFLDRAVEILVRCGASPGLPVAESQRAAQAGTDHASPIAPAFADSIKRETLRRAALRTVNDAHTYLGEADAALHAYRARLARASTELRTTWTTVNPKDKYTALRAAIVKALDRPPPPPKKTGQFLQQAVPATMVSGHIYSVTVTMRNTGTARWTPGGANPYRLGSQNPTDNQRWGLGRVELPPSTALGVEPGVEVTFLFNVVAPSAGVQNFQWQMLQEGVAWFGDFTPSITVEVLDSQQESQWIKALYADLLGRAAESSGLAGWMSRREAGGTLDETANAFLNSQEYCTAKVGTLYHQFLDRAAEPGGLQGWTNQLEQGVPLQNIIRAFCDSAEYKTNNAVPDAFVESLYKRLLGRASDPGGKRGWAETLTQGRGTASVINGFLGSQEYCTQRVIELYQKLLGRAPDPGGLAGWVSSATNGTPWQQIERHFLTSAEYRKRALSRTF